MPMPDAPVVPVLSDGVLICSAPADSIRLFGRDGTRVALSRIGRTHQYMVQPRPRADLVVSAEGVAPLHVQCGGWAGRVDRQQGGLVMGWARNIRSPGQDCAVVAWSGDRLIAVATARAAEGGRFLMVMPPEVTGTTAPLQVRLGIAGSDYALDGGVLDFAPPAPAVRNRSPRLFPLPSHELSIRIKISTPNLKEAPMWGDFHFANSLAASFERLGHQAGVDCADAWYAQRAHEDVVLTIRGRHRVKVDPGKVNIMWIISHPDRIPEDEYADYDHIAVASDIYAEELRERGLPSVSVLHQATDATLFFDDPERDRKPAALFVGNSRREYRTMVKWCVQKKVPLELYGGGWDGVLPDEMLRGVSIANADLPDYYGSHLLLLNDHWDSMRMNGFLSNRLFDGSGVATPILTDPVAGLADVFGDAISEAGDEDTFAAIIEDCLANPADYLDRARRAHDIVMAAHTFDHRAQQLSDLIDQIVARKRRMR